MKKVLYLLLVVMLALCMVFMMNSSALAADEDVGEAITEVPTEEPVIPDIPDIPEGATNIPKEGINLIVPVFYILGFALKKIPAIPDWLIPFILIAAGMLITMAALGWSVWNALEGAKLVGLTVLVNQLYKQGAEGQQLSKEGLSNSG
jgi:hypothetical protein